MPRVLISDKMELPGLEILRNAGIEQYLDNRKIYGYLTLWENVEACKKWMAILK